MVTVLNSGSGGNGEVSRDRWGRPLIIRPESGKAVAYTRCTTFVDCIEDKYNLQKWMQRQVALGLVDRDDLRLAVAAHRDDKREMDRICEAALEAARSSSRATIGTALHALTEQIDRGLNPVIPDAYIADIEAYRQVTSGWKFEHIERLVVWDKERVAGTPDRIVKIGSKRYIADLKTGDSLQFGALKMAMQLGVYSMSQLYAPGSGARSYHDADRERGIIIHLPAGGGVASAHWIDLGAGIRAAHEARRVREWRQMKASDLLEPFAPSTDSASTASTGASSLADQIAALSDSAAVRALWAEHQDVWTDELTKIAAQRVAELSNQVA